MWKNIFKMKYLKSHYKLALTDEYLQLILMIENTTFEPQIKWNIILSPKDSVLYSRPILQKKNSIVIFWIFHKIYGKFFSLFI